MDLADLPNNLAWADYYGVHLLHRQYRHSIILGAPGSAVDRAAPQFPFFRDPSHRSASSRRACQKIARPFGQAERSMK